MTVSLYGNGTPSFANSQGGGITIGHAFVTSQQGAVTALRWHRAATSGITTPDAISLWDSRGYQLAFVHNPADDGLIGWKQYDLPNPVNFDPGTVYFVTAHTPSGGARRQDIGTIRQATPFPLNWATNSVVYVLSSVDTFPTSQADNAEHPVDIVFDPGNTAGTPSTVPVSSVPDALAEWLSTTDNTHETDGLPWLTKVAADAIKVVTDKLGHGGSGNSLDWIAGLWRLAGDLTDAEIGLLKSLLDRKDQITGASGGGGSAFYSGDGRQVAQVAADTLDAVNALPAGLTLTDLGAAVALLRERLTLSPDLADDTRWTLVDTTSGDGDALVSQQADAYFLSITAYPASQAAVGVASTLWLPRWGWVCPRVHGHFAQRQFHDVMPTIITSEGHFMDGLLIYTPPGFEWTCESYALDR